MTLFDPQFSDHSIVSELNGRKKTECLFFGTDFFSLGIFPIVLFWVKGTGKGHQDKKGSQDAMLQFGKYSGQQSGLLLGTFHIVILPDRCPVNKPGSMP